MAIRFIDDLNIQCDTLADSIDDLKAMSAILAAEENRLLDVVREAGNKLREIESQKKEITEKIHAIEQPCAEIILNKPSITKKAAPKDKADFLIELFGCRNDVFALRKWNKKYDKVMYFPNCVMRGGDACPLKLYWKSENKKDKPDCMTCSFKKYAPLTAEEIIVRQFSNMDEHGDGAIGIYPVIDGKFCRFIAIDMDESSWKSDSLEMADVARRSGFQLAIERSFSGNGAHLWLFFSENVLAEKARRLAFSFIDKACNRCKSISLKSYDRVFPTQDSVANGGLGNLILLPLVRYAVMRSEQSGTVFVDNDFRIYEDQLAFLSSLPRYSDGDIDSYFIHESIARENIEDNCGDIDVSWNGKKAKISLSDCIIKPLPVFLSAGVSIPKSAMSARLQNALKRFASFFNPLYFKYKHLYKGYIPPDVSEFICSFVESDTVLQLPRGIFDSLKRYFDEFGIEYKIHDIRTSSTGLDAEFHGTLRPEQEEAVNRMEKAECGILRAATSFGKTVVAASLIAKRRERTLILVCKQDLLKQWSDSLAKFLVIKNEPVKKRGHRLNQSGIGLYGGAKDSCTGLVDIAMIQSMASRKPDFIKDYGMVIVDECHHVAAKTVLDVMQSVRPKYVYGLSATVRRDDGLEKLIYLQCGPVLYSYEAALLASNRGIAQYFVPRFTNRIIGELQLKTNGYTDMLKCIAADAERNKLIVSDIASLVSSGRRILVLSHLLSHIDELKKMLDERKIKAVLISGSQSKDEQDFAFQSIVEDKNSVLLSTGKYVGEGTDIPHLDTLFIVTPISWEGVVSQYAGRIAREYEGKQDVLIYDYVDICIPQFSKMYLNRLRTYRKLGFVPKEAVMNDVYGNENNADEGKKALFEERRFHTQNDIYDAFERSLFQAARHIVICSPALYLSHSTKKFVEILSKKAASSVKVEILTGSAVLNPQAQQASISYMRSKGLGVESVKDCFLHYAVIDDTEVYFGDMNLLGGCIKDNRLLDKTSDISDLKVMLHIYDSETAKALGDVKSPVAQ